MDFNATIDLIIKDLDDARNIIDDLKRYPEVPVLQIELAKAKCKSASEVISLLKSMNEDHIPKARNTLATPDANLTDHDQNNQEKTDSIINTIEPEPDILDLSETDELQTRIIEPDDSMVTEENKSEMQNVTEKSVSDIPPLSAEKDEMNKSTGKTLQNSIIADRFSHLSGSFNEQLGSNKAKDDVSEMMKSKPVSSLTEAIGINDRFLFIREIFDGNKDAYNDAIGKLESSQTFDDAKAIVTDLTDDTNNEAVKQLLNLIKRKFPLHE